MLKSLFKILDNRAAGSNLLKGALTALTVEGADLVLQDTFGEKISKFAHASHIKDKVLFIACRGGAAAQEIRMRQDEIVKKINDKAEALVVEKIKIIL